MKLLESNPRGFDAALSQVMQGVPLFSWYLKDSSSRVVGLNWCQIHILIAFENAQNKHKSGHG